MNRFKLSSNEIIAVIRVILYLLVMQLGTNKTNCMANNKDEDTK